MTDSFGAKEILTKVIEAGPVKIDNPVVEVVVGVAAAAGLLYAGYKVLTDRSAADNVATVLKSTKGQDN